MNTNLQSSYRHEIISNDQWHKNVVMLLSLITVGLAIAHSITEQAAFRFWIPILIVAQLGTIIRLETMVHRMGAFLKKEGDIWEQFRGKLLHDKFYLTMGDILMMAPAGVALGYYFYHSINYALDSVYIVVILFEVLLWITAPFNVRKHASDK
ncbi:MAG TPA: hypothetical protein PKD79_00520 [Candidatus Doudnabacteria bacterium]|nr:hypothetical protein [Candidatus Doudnabacteria bacterium]